MDWKKIDREIKLFASGLNSQLVEKDIGFIGGKITTFKFSEPDNIFYELKHSKPESEIGSKFQMESILINEGIEIIVKKNFFGKLKTKINGYVSPEIKEEINKLSTFIYEFKWTTNAGKGEFSNRKMLKFKTTDIDLDSVTMNLIRKIHLELAG